MADKTEFHPKLPSEGEDPTNALLTKAEQAERDHAQGKLEKGEARVYLENDFYDGDKHWEKGIRVMSPAAMEDENGKSKLPSTAYILGKDETIADVLRARTKRRFADAKPVPGSDGKPVTRSELTGQTSFADTTVKQTARK
jgi:hypothetical protein